MFVSQTVVDGLLKWVVQSEKDKLWRSAGVGSMEKCGACHGASRNLKTAPRPNAAVRAAISSSAESNSTTEQIMFQNNLKTACLSEDN